MNARIWRGRIRTGDRAAYVEYIERTGLAEYRSTPGNEGAWMLTRDLDDGTTEVVTLSFWTSREAIHGFAGDDLEVRHRRLAVDQVALVLGVEHRLLDVVAGAG